MAPLLLLPAIFLLATGPAHTRPPRTTAAPLPPAAATVNLSVRATALETLGEIGLQTRVPIGIIPGKDAGALCRTKTTFVFLGEDPRDALDGVAQELHYTLNQEDGVYLLTAPDVTAHQHDVLDHRFRVYRAGRNSMVQLLSIRLSEALWSAFTKSVSTEHRTAIYHPVDTPRIALPSVLHNVTAQDIAGLVVRSGPHGIYVSHINPSRVASPDDLLIQISSYGDPGQLKLDMDCQH